MKIHRVCHGRIDLHFACLVATVLGAQFVPALAGGHGREGRAGRNQAQVCRLVAPLLAQNVPAGVVAALVFVDEILWRLDRHMVGLERHIGEEWLATALARVDVVDGPVDEILGRVERRRHCGPLAVFKPVDLGRMGQITLLRVPVVRAGVALHDGAVEAALVGPVVGLGADIPLAGGVGPVTTVLQQAGHGDDLGRQRSLVTRLAHVRAWHGFAQIAHAIAVVVHAGQQHRTGR